MQKAGGRTPCTASSFRVVGGLHIQCVPWTQRASSALCSTKSHSTSRSAPRRAAYHCCKARKVQTEAEVAQEWAVLAEADPDIPDEEDPEVQESINKLCNKAVRLMLAEDDRSMQDFRDELSQMGQYFSGRNNMRGATFIYVLYRMTEHVLVKDMIKLEDIYLRAFEKLYGLVEESGWVLNREGEEQQEEAQDVPSAPLPTIGVY